MNYIAVKLNKRLHIEVWETGEIVYSLPFWLRSQLHDREELASLAATFNDRQCRDIVAIIDFEAMLRRRLQKEE